VRFVLLSLAALGVVIVLAAIGFQSSTALVQWQMDRLGIEQLYMTSPTEPFAVSLRYAIGFALPIVVAWGAALLHQLRGPAVPIRAFAMYAAIAAAVFAIVIVGPILLARPLEVDGLRPMVTLESFALSARQLAFAVMLASVPCVLLAVRASGVRPPPPPAGAGASPTPAP
jgi:hypothetical protein